MMTREHKIALIVGFALVLVVGVLVSDHLSGARDARLVEIDLPDQDELPITRPAAPDLQRFAHSNEPETERRLTHLEPSDSIRSQPAETALASAPMDEQTMLDTMRDRVNDAMRELRNGNGPTPAVQTDARGSITMGENQSRPRQGTTGEVRTHIVRRGETLWAIAEQYYGTGFVHEDLRRYNASRIRSTRDLNPGLTLLIPDRRELGTAPSGPVREQAVKPATPQAIGARVYVVKKGDTLSEISLAELGTSKRWEEILSLNSDRLDEATDIAVGMKIKLPRR